MFVLIDMNRLVFCHKHVDRNVVSNLATIEVAHSHASIVPVNEPRCLHHLTMLELQLLYQHTTGHKFDGFSHLHLEEMVLSLARSLPESDVDSFEVLRQSAMCASDAVGFYKYVKGSSRPALCDELYEPPALTGNAVTTLPPVHEPLAPSTNVLANITRAPSEPRKGSRAIIFAVADEMWAHAGSPQKLEQVLALRKQIMVELETKHNIKKTTSSTALGEWQKVRLNN